MSKKRKPPKTRAGLLRSNLVHLRTNLIGIKLRLELMSSTRGQVLHRANFTDGMFIMEQAAKIGGMRSVAEALSRTIDEINKILEIDKDAMRRS